MPIISSSPDMELYVHRLLPSLPQNLFFLILTACCASLIPCCLGLNAQYQYCQNHSKCGTMNISYPFGVGNRGCGHQSFQMNCVHNSSSVIKIHGQNYTILAFLDPTLVIITRGQKCQFLDASMNNQTKSSEFEGFTFTATENLTVYTYKCNIPDQLQPSKCNASFYYSLYEDKSSTRKCHTGQVTVHAAIIHSIRKTEICESCQASQGICGYKTSGSTVAPPFLCYCNDGSRADKCPGHGRREKAVIIIGCSVGGAALTAVLSLAYYLKKRKSPPNGGLPRQLPGREIGNLPIFSYEALRQTTNCFHEENELGVGGFGSVYLGKLWDGRIVAVKRLYQENSRRLDQFINEVKIFSTLNHPHVVRLYGCTPADSPELLLVYEFVPNGTLASHLHGDRKTPKGLPWNIRLNIAIQSAEALSFLHALDPPLLHRDVKSANILLDENFNVKLADFGLCRVVPVDASHVTTIPQGTPGYVDPQYYQCYQLTDKSDVYSFGVVLVEIISSKTAMDISRNRGEINLANLAITKIQEGDLYELVDLQLEIEVNLEVKVMVSAVAELAFRCLASERDDRPDMEEVVAQLEEIRHSCGTSTGPGPQQQLGSFSNIKQLNIAPSSPISVQDN